VIEVEHLAESSSGWRLLARVAEGASQTQHEVTVTQEHVHVIWMSAKVPPLTRDHIRQARDGGTNVSPPGPQEDQGNPSLRRRVWR